jgi:hypothetical protein
VHDKLARGALVKNHVAPTQGAFDRTENDGVAVMDEKGRHAAAGNDKGNVVPFPYQITQGGNVFSRVKLTHQIFALG